MELTRREYDVIKLICKGLTNVEIGEELQLSKRTIDSHRASIYKKLNITCSIGLFIYAIQYGIIKPIKLKKNMYSKLNALPYKGDSRGAN